MGLVQIHVTFCENVVFQEFKRILNITQAKYMGQESIVPCQSHGWNPHVSNNNAGAGGRVEDVEVVVIHHPDLTIHPSKLDHPVREEATYLYSDKITDVYRCLPHLPLLI